MSQRMAFIIAGALTAFVLVLMAGVAASVAIKSGNVTAAQAQAPSALVAEGSSAAAVQITVAQATEIAQRAAPGAKLTRTPELVNFQGSVAYEVLLNQGTLYVDANSGSVLFNSAAAVVSAPVQNGRAERQHDEGQEEFEEHDDD